MKRATQADVTHLSTAIAVGGLIRAAEHSGGNGMVVRSGDRESGSLVLILASRGQTKTILERIADLENGYAWRSARAGDSLNAETVARFVADRARFDADFWAVELDIPDVEQFIVESLG